MNWIYKLQRKFGKYAIEGITKYLIICYAIGYMISFVNPEFLNFLRLDPYFILHGQVWRLFTWILIPPEAFGFFTLIMLYFYWSIGNNLEQVWGTFFYNVFLFSGAIFTIIGAFLLYGYFAITGSDAMSFIGYFFSTEYICMSLFLGYAITFPDAQILFMMFIPLKVKVLGIIYALMIGYQVLTALAYRDEYGYGLCMAVGIISSLLNVLIFFLSTRKGFKSPKQARRQREFKREVRKVTSITRHKCAICGRTEVDSPHLEFRFCSKCDGNYEYCEEHLYSHKHVEK